VHPLLGPVDGMERGAYDLIGPGLRHFFRDVNDHLKLVDEEVVTQRDTLAMILQANMAVVSVAQNEISVRQNETARQLTLIATIFLPLTFITGFFGQNFGWLVAHIASFWEFAVIGLGSLVISAFVLYFGITRYQEPQEPLSGGRGPSD
jgi:magnesium transporter